MYDLLIKNGFVVSAKETRKADVAVSGEKIVKVAEHIEEEARRVIDAEGKYVFPGGVEGHMHAKSKKAFQGCYGANDFYDQSVSAAFGGVTTFMDFSQTSSKGTVMEAVQDRLEEMSISAIDYAMHGKIVTREQCSEIPELIEMGIPTFKLFMTYRKDGVMADADTLLEAFRMAKQYGGIPMIHCEDNAIAESNEEMNEKNGTLSWVDFAKAKPALCEAAAFAQAAYYAYYAGNALIIVHTTNTEALEIGRRLKEKGMPLYIETCPHYLTLFKDLYKQENGHLAICSPPLRTPEDAKELWKGIQDGVITLYGSDDCTYSYEEKSMHLEKHPDGTFVQDYRKIVNGLSGLETRLPILMTEGVEKGRISVNKVVELTSENSARTYGVFPQKGIVAEGSDADILIIDPKKKTVLSADVLHNNIDYCLFEGKEVTGFPDITIYRGKVIVENGEFYGEKGHGRFLKRHIPEEILTGKK